MPTAYPSEVELSQWPTCLFIIYICIYIHSLILNANTMKINIKLIFHLYQVVVVEVQSVLQIKVYCLYILVKVNEFPFIYLFTPHPHIVIGEEHM